MKLLGVLRKLLKATCSRKGAVRKVTSGKLIIGARALLFLAAVVATRSHMLVTLTPSYRII